MFLYVVHTQQREMEDDFFVLFGSFILLIHLFLFIFFLFIYFILSYLFYFFGGIGAMIQFYFDHRFLSSYR